MIVQKEFLNRIKDFGLNSYEAKLWTALLSRGISTAGELSDIANVPRSRSYDVLESLERKGFIVMKIGKPIKYIAVHPEEVVERVKKKIKEDAETQSDMMDTLKKSEVLDELNLLHSQGVALIDPAELSGAIKGRNIIYHHLESMINNAEKSVVMMTTAGGLMRKQDSLKKAFKKAKARGVDIKIAAPVDSHEDIKQVSEFATVRTSKETPSRFVVVDGKDLAFMVMDDKDVHPSYDMAIWVKTPFFAQSMENMFNKLWKDMAPVKKK